MAERKRAVSIQFGFQYAAKFLCLTNISGTSSTSSSVLPGAYRTVVNIHNPNGRIAIIRTKIALTGPSEISKFVPGRLKPDQATRVDCEQIARDYGIKFIHGAEGFLVIESTLSLDVIAVYTAGQARGEVESIDVEQVRERKLLGATPAVRS